MFNDAKKKYMRVKEITAAIEEVAGGTKNIRWPRGGMLAKIDAIKCDPGTCFLLSYGWDMQNVWWRR